MSEPVNSPRLRAWAVLVPVVAVLAGLLFGTAASTARGRDLRSSATALPDLIRERTQENARAAARVKSLRSNVDALSAEAAPAGSGLAEINSKADALAPSVGLSAVKGTGLTVSLNDAKVPSSGIPDGRTADDYVVHQQDVQNVVNALWRGGAEAMMLMDQRVISTSAVRCVGNTLILQGRVYSPPFTITVIGDPAALRKALENDEEVSVYREWVKAVGLGYDISDNKNVTMPGFDGQTDLTSITSESP